MKTTLTVWNKTIQSLVRGDLKSARLAFILCNKKDIIHWWRLGPADCSNMGLPYIDKVNSIFSLITTEYNQLYQSTAWHDSLKYMKQLKQTL